MRKDKTDKLQRSLEERSETDLESMKVSRVPIVSKIQISSITVNNGQD